MDCLHINLMKLSVPEMTKMTNYMFDSVAGTCRSHRYSLTKAFCFVFSEICASFIAQPTSIKFI